MLDPIGSPHMCGNSLKQRDRHDVVLQKNKFFQSLHNSNVTYNPVGKQAAIFSTMPSKTELKEVFINAKLTNKADKELRLD